MPNISWRQSRDIFSDTETNSTISTRTMDGSSTQTNANNALNLNNLTLEIERLNAEMTR